MTAAGDRLVAGAGAAWRRAATWRGVDATAASRSRRCLVLAPHPDDETLGCAATLRAKVQHGTEVAVAIATDGSRSTRSQRISPPELARLRRDEALRAGAALGVPAAAYRFLDVPDGELGQHHGELAAWLRRLVAEVRPEELLVTAPQDGHPDHVALDEAVRRLLPELGDVLVAEYPTWWWWMGYDARGVAGRGRAGRALARGRALAANGRALRPVLVSTEGHLEAKRAAIAAHASQFSNLTGEPGWTHLPAAFAERFCGPYEVFFPLRPAATAPWTAAAATTA